MNSLSFQDVTLFVESIIQRQSFYALPVLSATHQTDTSAFHIVYIKLVFGRFGIYFPRISAIRSYAYGLNMLAGPQATRLEIKTRTNIVFAFRAIILHKMLRLFLDVYHLERIARFVRSLDGKMIVSHRSLAAQCPLPILKRHSIRTYIRIVFLGCPSWLLLFSPLFSFLFST